MKINILKVATIGCLLLANIERGHSQGTFVNLNFENPILPLESGPPVPISSAFPGWVGYRGSSQIGQALYNDVSIGGAWISLQGPGSSFPPIQGSYSAILQPSSAGPQTSAALGQTGQISVTAQSLRFFSGSQDMLVTFGGQTIPMTVLGSTPEYLIMGGDISAYAGQTGELRFTMPVVQFSYNIPYLDNILFSDQPIPEPSTFGLFGLGTLLLSWRFRRRQ